MLLRRSVKTLFKLFSCDLGLGFWLRKQCICVIAGRETRIWAQANELPWPLFNIRS